MQKKQMRKFHIYIETAGAAESLKNSLTQLQDMGVESCFHSLFQQLKQMRPETAGCVKEEAVWAELGLGDRDDALYLTDIPEFAALLAAGHYPVIAYVHEGNRQCSFGQVRYVIEGFEDVDGEYFIRTYQRLTGQPWHILDTERCIIRETTVEDVDAFYDIYREPSVIAYMEDLFADREEEIQYTRDYIEKVYGFYGFGMWTVVLKETGEVIGRAGLSMREGYDDPELGFVIGVPWQGQGIAAEVCRAILTYGKEELGFERIQALVHPQNQISKGLLEKLDFEYDSHVTIRGEVFELYIRV